MRDLISRQAVIDALELGLENDYVDATEFLTFIKQLPSAEPERKNGKWIDGMLYHDFDESEWEKVKCSVCKNFVTKQIFYHDNKYHYCPYCGADMRGDQ